MATKSSLYVVVFTSRVSGQIERGRIFQTLRGARANKRFLSTFADNVRIMKGGPGGMEVN